MKWDCSTTHHRGAMSAATEEERSTYDAVTHYIDRRFEEVEQQRTAKGS
jgi:hypothetical protein